MKSAIMRGLGTLLNESGLGYYVPNSPAPANSRGIYLGSIPEHASTAIGVAVYNEVPGVVAIAETFVQFRIRGTQSLPETWDIADALRDLLHRRSSFNLGTVHIDLCTLVSMSPAAPNGNGVYELTQNYRLLHMQGSRI